MMRQHSDNPSRFRIAHYVLGFGAFMFKFGVGMTNIFSQRDYLQIFQAIIGLDSISVIYCHAFGNRADKGRSYKRVDALPKLATLQTENKLKVSSFCVQARPHKPWLSIDSPGLVVPKVARSHSSLITDLISGESLNRLPLFCHVSLPFRCFDSIAGCGEYV